MKQSPIFSKTYDFILWLLNHTESFPKSERFRMARRLEDTAFEFYELLIQAGRSTRRRQQALLEADLVLDKLRLYLRLSNARGLTTGTTTSVFVPPDRPPPGQNAAWWPSERVSAAPCVPGGRAPAVPVWPPLRSRLVS